MQKPFPLHKKLTHKDLANQLLDQIGRFLQSNGRVYLQTGTIDYGFAFLGIGSLQAYDDGHLNVAQFFISLYHPGGHTITTYNAAKDID